ncbi:MAG: ABC transporter permease [Anaerovoracaceae bacterium]
MKGRRISYYARKTIILIMSIFLLSAAVFAMSRLTPVDPLQSYYGDRTEKMSVQEKDEAREKLGLNDSIAVQYVRWVSNALDGDLGISYKYKQPVTEVTSGRLLNTLLLGGLGFIIIFALAVLIGLFCAGREGRTADRIICRLGTLSSCIPDFWLALMLIFLFSVTWHIFPSSNAYSAGGGGFADRLYHLVLPLTVVVISHLWYYSYMIRNMILEEVRKDYVLLYKSIGLTDREILVRHCLRNIMPGLISVMAISVSHVLGGTYVTEMVFSYPGIGTLCYESARYSDYNLLMYLCMLTGGIVITLNIIGQIISERIDPRVRAEEKGGEVM